MRIGIYGGIANNMYVFAKALAESGADVNFIRDRTDRFPFSQPVWEDIPFTMRYEEATHATAWSWQRWSEQERALGWIAPRWLREPDAEAVGNAMSSLPLFVRYYLRRQPHRPAVLRQMQACDVVLACGIEASILANASGRPFILWPFGGDMIIAAGRQRPPLSRPRAWLAHRILQRELAKAFANAICIGSHEPTAIQADYFGAEQFLRRQKIAFLPIPIPVRESPAPEQRRRQLGALFAELGLRLPDARVFGFVPSRIDYEWKAQDRLLRAFVEVARSDRGLHLIFSGWGGDYHAARQFVDEQGLAERVTFLAFALSKPLLNRFYQSTDFVVDQFVLGMCGTAALEAMACGAALLTWVSDAYERPWGAPPVLNARTSEQIATVLRDVMAGKIDLPARGRALQQWIDRVHSPRAALPKLMTKFAEARC